MSLKKLFIILFGIQFVLVVGLGLMILRLFRYQEDLQKSRDLHFHSWLLADELRQSSDDLTRMARTYVSTGNAEYERQYLAVLDIRDGKRPRPVNYQHIYWDLVIGPGQEPRENDTAVSLHDLMAREGFTPVEFTKLQEAQKNSDELVKVERAAMNAIKGFFDDGKGNFTVKKTPDREFAIRLLNDDAFHKTKASIMKPINEFYVIFDKRTTHDFLTIERHSKNLLLGITGLIVIVLGTFIFSFVMILRQINQREKVEELVRIDEEKYRTLIDTMTDGVYRSSHEGKFLEVNPALVKMLGYDSKEELLAIDIKSQLYFSEEDRESSDLEEKLEEMAIFRLKKKDGSEIWVEDHGRHVLDDKGGILYHEGSLRDVTERKLAENEIELKNEELQRLNAEKDKLLSIIAHDLRSPFNSLLGFTEMLVEELPSLSKDEIQKIAVSMRKSTTSLYALLENLLEWSRLQRGLIPYNPEVFPLRHKLAETIEVLMESANKKGISISYDIPADMEVYADRNMFEVIIRNLTSNAIKFTYEQGKVILSAGSMPDSSVKISITDTGIGMNEAMITNLFRFDENTNRKGTSHEPSTGLGLIICREFIEKHGGTLQVVSEENKGSTFTLTLPSKL
ncbi:MAG: PAS domain-containing sensor histidine kinase [Bacteroidetes bacterium]|nr:PAS domain-containing sensor histidine kinase [Bacteroidota bacterium]